MIRMFLCSLLMLPALAQQPSTEQPSTQEVRALLDVMGSRKNIEVMMKGMSEAMRQGMHQSFRQKVPNASPELLQKLDATMPDFDKVFTADEMIDASIPVYQANLTREEVKAMYDFYSSEVGKRIMEKMPKLVSESMQSGQKMAMEKVQKLSEELDRRMDEFIAAMEKEQQKPGSDGPSKPASKPPASKKPAPKATPHKQ